MPENLLTKQRKAVAAELFLRGLNNVRIARALGISQTATSKYLEDPELRRSKGELDRRRIRNALRRHGLGGE